MAISVKVMPANHHIWDYLGKFDHDLTVLPNPGIMV